MKKNQDISRNMEGKQKLILKAFKWCDNIYRSKIDQFLNADIYPTFLH